MATLRLSFHFGLTNKFPQPLDAASAQMKHRHPRDSGNHALRVISCGGGHSPAFFGRVLDGCVARTTPPSAFFGLPRLMFWVFPQKAIVRRKPRRGNECRRKVRPERRARSYAALLWYVAGSVTCARKHNQPAAKRRPIQAATNARFRSVSDFTQH